MATGGRDQEGEDTLRKEYRFAAAEYDEQKGVMRCPICGEVVGDDELLVRVETKDGAFWSCVLCGKKRTKRLMTAGMIREEIER